MQETKKIKEKRQLIEEYVSTLGEIRNFMSLAVVRKKKGSSITMLQLEALFFLNKVPKGTAGMLAKKLSMSSSATAQLTERLTKKGWIRRKNDKIDRRVVHLMLTEKGEKEIELRKKSRFEKVERLASFIPVKNLEELVRIHKELIANIHKNNNEKTP